MKRIKIRSLCLGLLVAAFESIAAWLHAGNIAWQSGRRQARPHLPTRSSVRVCEIHSSALSLSVQSEDKMDLKILLIDHYDSFTYNLADYLSQFCQTPPLVLATDCANSWDDLLQSPAFVARNWTRIDGIVLSPGPGCPETAGRLSREVIAKNPDLPIFGVCLGHQIMGHVYGAKVERAPEPVHGQVRPVRVLDKQDDLWRGVSFGSDGGSTVNVTRYHSLHVVNLTDRTGLIPTALTEGEEENIVMSMRHKDHPHFGVQFHPESIGTSFGKELVFNFCRICDMRSDSSVLLQVNESSTFELESPRKELNVLFNPDRYKIFIHKVKNAGAEPRDIMDQFIAQQSNFSFWLDEVQTCTEKQYESRKRKPAISILGMGSNRVEYWGKEKPIDKQGLYVWRNGLDSPTHFPDQNILSYLRQVHSAPIVEASVVHLESDGRCLVERSPETMLSLELPFAFRGGHVGYLGYEVRHDTARSLEEKEQGRYNIRVDPTKCESDPLVPTAAFIWADKSFVFDHENGDWYLVGVLSSEQTANSEMLEWMKVISDRIRNLIPRHAVDELSEFNKNGKSEARRTFFHPSRPRKIYNENFDQCIDFIRQGESYELCLTNQLVARVPRSDPLQLYKTLRRRNPAPFSAFFDWNSAGTLEYGTGSALAICCSSPERFLSVKRMASSGENVNGVDRFKLQVEAKPIKGTRARAKPLKLGAQLTTEDYERDRHIAESLQQSVKDRAENLMIVDLLRNDLSRVCETGTVHVAKLMDVESFSTVHQMVSTIRGELDPSKSSVLDVLEACFPGGSMTGAPKLRTMELLDQLEESMCRGPYSGSLGYISLNGCMDMNIIIRTAVLTPGNIDEWKVTIGAGGAITILSENEDEYQEMLLKASAVMQAVEEWALSSNSCSPKNSSESQDKLFESQLNPKTRTRDELDSVF